jgi:type IV pilus assembly protein PilB
MKVQLASVLQKNGILTAEQIAEAQKLSQSTKRSFSEILLKDMGVAEERLAEVFAEHFRLPYVRLAAATVDPGAVKLLSESQARKLVCLPIKKEESTAAAAVRRRPTLVLAMSDPSDLAAIQQVEFATGCVVKPVVATRTEVEDALDHYYAPEDWLNDFLRNINESENFEVFSPDDDESQGKGPVKAGKDSPAVKMANVIIQNAIHQEASDIHIEPGLNHVQVRNRIQGLLREYMQMPKWIQDPLVSRIKILAQLDISERRVPQDGRIKVSFEKREADLRVSTLPTHFGEKVVIRILGSGSKVPSTSSLGLGEEDLEILRNAAGQPQGMVLVTGPTGSGKTTTLYSVIDEKKSPDINIITVEDPIEFQLPGINQVQLNTKAGLTFAASLRSILRQDPDVILVGEIRDLETAEIAFHAAITGHLVLSTLHTNGTAATIGRLLDLGVDPQLMSSSINLIVAQRLLRKLCPNCKQRCKPDPKVLQRLQLEDAQIDYYGPSGCEMCAKSGYSGRIGVYELLRVAPNIRDLITKNASEPEFHQTAIENGMIPLLEGAIDLARDGITSVEEIVRVIQLQDEGMTRCPNCAVYIDRDFTACPHCTYALKVMCESCEQELKPGWRICPYCSATVEKPSSALNPGKPRALPPGSSTMIPPQAARQVETEPVAAIPEPRKRPRILVVDDDEVMRAIIMRAVDLLPQKPEILEASNGRDALNMATELKPDLILLDVMMPGMNGIEVCQRLRSNIQTAFLPVVMLTASTDEETRTKGFLVGTDDFMGKPLSVPELHARLNRLLRRTYGL